MRKSRKTLEMLCRMKAQSILKLFCKWQRSKFHTVKTSTNKFRIYWQTAATTTNAKNYNTVTKIEAKYNIRVSLVIKMPREKSSNYQREISL